MSFRLFSQGEAEFGGWSENPFLEDDQDRSGGIAYFDAWPQCTHFDLRVWHIKEDAKINLKGHGFKVINEESKYIADSCEMTGRDLGTYLTKYSFTIESEGVLELELEGELPQDNNKLSWEGGTITDFRNRKATYKEIQGGYELREVLSRKELEKFAIVDRVLKLEKMMKSMGDLETHHELVLGRIHGDFYET